MYEYKCVFCNAEVSEDYYCYGCEETVCGDCDRRCPKAIGSHSFDAHEACEYDCDDCRW